MEAPEHESAPQNTHQKHQWTVTAHICDLSSGRPVSLPLPAEGPARDSVSKADELCLENDT